MTPLRQRMIADMQLRNLGLHTQHAYLQYVSQFAGHFHKSPETSGAGTSTTSYPPAAGRRGYPSS